MKKIRLCCFPYAGGSAVAIYSKWKRYLPEHIELFPMELPGRGQNIQFPPLGDLLEASRYTYEQFIKSYQGEPYAVFGHSLGAIIGYEFIRLMGAYGHPLPAHLFVSGRIPPHVCKDPSQYWHVLEEEAFIANIVDMGGTDPELFRHAELRQLILPVLRADFRMIELYRYEPRPALPIDVTVLYGSKEDEVKDHAPEWGNHVTGKCELSSFAGGHFFLNDWVEDICRLIERRLALDNVKSAAYF